MIRKLTIIFQDSAKNKNPEYYNRYIPKPMLMTKSFELIDKNLDNLKDWGCGISRLRQHC